MTTGASDPWVAMTPSAACGAEAPSQGLAEAGLCLAGARGSQGGSGPPLNYDRNVPSPLPMRTLTESPPTFETTRSILPSAFKSTASTETGCEPVA